MNTEFMQNTPQPGPAVINQDFEQVFDFEQDRHEAPREAEAREVNGRERRERRHAASKAKGLSKKDQVLEMYKSGVEDPLEIALRCNARPSYVAQVLQQAGLLQGYFDLYTSTGKDQNIYSRFFRNVLSFKSVEAARESVARIDSLFKFFEELGDRAGQHHAMVLAGAASTRRRKSSAIGWPRID